MVPQNSPFFRRMSLAGCALLFSITCSAQLNVNYGPNGLQQLSYFGTVLEDVGQYPGDAFHISHMKVTDLAGNLQTGAADGWGENSLSKTWNAASHTWTYLFAWGSIQAQFLQAGDTLNVVVTETNRPNSGVILDGAAIYAFGLHFPALPAGFVNTSYPQLAFNTTGPSALLADFGSGEVAIVVPDATKPLYSGFWPAGGGTPAYSALVSGTAPDGLATFQPHNDRPVAPGQTDSFTLSLRFAPSRTPLSALAGDAYASWSATWPAQLNWTDKRIIGTSYLASSPTNTGDVTQPGGFASNPRRFFNDSNPSDFDIRTPMGLALFQKMVLQRARDVVNNLQRLGAQGAITWDLEGEEYPQDTTYVCSPDQVAIAAPEMESFITDTSSPFAGSKLDDAYFKTISSAGFRVGVCIRPQQFIRSANGTSQQVYLSDAAAEAVMLQKIRYAHDRWGATLFYIDSSVEQSGMPLDAGMFQRIGAAFPDSLLIPEESTPKHYAYTAPFLTFIFHRDLGTDPAVRAYYPKAFSANLINDVDPGTLATYTPQLTASVAAGDILMTHADYWQANNPAIVAIYQQAGVTATPIVIPPVVTVPVVTPPVVTVPVVTIPVVTGPVDTTPIVTAPVVTAPVVTVPVVTVPVVTVPVVTVPVVTVPVVTVPVVTVPANPTPDSRVQIQSPSPGDTLSGTVQVTASIATTLDAAGSYLMVDGLEIGTAHLSSPPFIYPLDTTMLASGQHTLQIWAHNSNDQILLSAGLTVNVSNTAAASTAPVTVPVVTAPAPTAPGVATSGPVSITFPASGQAISGVISVAASIQPQLDAAASYLMVDGQQYGYQRVGSAPYLYTLDTATLAPGTHTLQVWAHDTNNDVLIASPVSITVVH